MGVVWGERGGFGGCLNGGGRGERVGGGSAQREISKVCLKSANFYLEGKLSRSFAWITQQEGWGGGGVSNNNMGSITGLHWFHFCNMISEIFP